MPIIIYDTKLGGKTELKTLTPGHVKLYVCGITAYDYCHIGHARSALAFDMIVKYLRYRGFKVTYVRNFTDIDDKIIKRAQEQETSTEELSERFIQAFHDDMKRLGVDPADIEPRATEHVDEIIRMIEELIAKGLAYEVDGDVYYAVEKFANYGALSGRSLDEMKAGARISVDERKRNPMDFALWKSSKPGEPTWNSPWGAGRPGWHIECSAMSRHFHGDTFDIHGGGKDLIFPHHENEIAQSEGATGKPFANAWIHHGFVTIKDEKMSKSLGNFLTIRNVLEKYHPEVLRLFVFSTHYRNPLDYSVEALDDASAGLGRLYSCLADINALPDDGPADGRSVVSKKDRARIETLAERFQQAMDNDFNTAKALGHVFDAVKTINKVLRALPKGPSAGDIKFLRQAGDLFRELVAVVGLLREDPARFIKAGQEKLLAELNIDRQAVDDLVLQRNRARADKDWSRSDAIRDQLLEQHIELKDGPEGTSWKVVRPHANK